MMTAPLVVAELGADGCIVTYVSVLLLYFFLPAWHIFFMIMFTMRVDVDVVFFYTVLTQTNRKRRERQWKSCWFIRSSHAAVMRVPLLFSMTDITRLALSFRAEALWYNCRQPIPALSLSLRRLFSYICSSISFVSSSSSSFCCSCDITKPI